MMDALAGAGGWGYFSGGLEAYARGFRFVAVQVAGLRGLAGMSGDGLRLGLEPRAYRQRKLPEALRRTMEQDRVLDVVDLSQGPPRIPDEVVYTRLFGPGPANVYQFDDAELRAIDRAAGDAVRAAFTFHGVRMYTDAARFLTFRRTGTFPPATSARGPASLGEVLRSDARFPATREELEREHGWKVVDLDDRTRVHAARLIENLPTRTYASVADVLSEIEIPVSRAARSSPEGAYLGPK